MVKLESLKEAGKLTSTLSSILIPVSLGLTAIIFSNLKYSFQMWVKVLVFVLLIFQSFLYIVSLSVGITLFKAKEELKSKFNISFYCLISAVILTAISYILLIASVFFG